MPKNSKSLFLESFSNLNLWPDRFVSFFELLAHKCKAKKFASP